LQKSLVRAGLRVRDPALIIQRLRKGQSAGILFRYLQDKHYMTKIALMKEKEDKVYAFVRLKGKKMIAKLEDLGDLKEGIDESYFDVFEEGKPVFYYGFEPVQYFNTPVQPKEVQGGHLWTQVLLDLAKSESFLNGVDWAKSTINELLISHSEDWENLRPKEKRIKALQVFRRILRQKGKPFEKDWKRQALEWFEDRNYDFARDAFLELAPKVDKSGK